MAGSHAMSSVQCWKQPAFAVSTFSTNSTLHGENFHVKSGESGILSTISTIALSLLSTFYSALLLSPTLWREWRKSAAKHAFRPQNRYVLPVLSPHQAISASAAAAAATKKRTRFPIRFCLYFLLCTFYCCATILPHLLLRHPSPQQLRLFVAPNSPFWPVRRSCQVPQFSDFSQNQSVKLKNLTNFSPILPFLTEGNVVVFVATIFRIGGAFP
jgi:hypothetical protein